MMEMKYKFIRPYTGSVLPKEFESLNSEVVLIPRRQSKSLYVSMPRGYGRAAMLEMIRGGGKNSLIIDEIMRQAEKEYVEMRRNIHDEIWRPLCMPERLR